MHLEWTTPTAALPLLVLAIVAAGLWTRRHYRRTVPPARGAVGRLLPWLRWSALILILLAAAGPLLVMERIEEIPASVLVLVEDSASMAQDDGPDRRTRWERAAAVAAAVDSVTALHDVAVVQRRGNGLQDARPYRPDDSVPPAAQGTDLAALLDAGAAGARAPRLTVLITDGHATAGDPTAGGRREDLILAGVGDPVGPGDLAVRDVQAPDLAFVGDEVTVEAVIGLREPLDAERRVRVTLEHAGAVVDDRTLIAGPDDRTLRVELRDRPDAPGLRELTVRVAPLAGERFLGNNSAVLALKVRAERRRLLALTTRPGWLVRVLAQAAAAEDRLELEVVYPGPDGPRSSRDDGPWTPPADAEAWRDRDGVLLLDAEAARRWADGTGLALAAREGLGLLLLDTGQEGAWPADLAGLLPARPTGAGAVRGALMVPDRRHPLAAAPEDDARGWSRLPPLTVAAPAEAPASASVLLAVAAPVPVPVLTVREEQGRRLAWLGSRDLWEQAFWSPGSDDAAAQPLRRLLRNVLVWTAQGSDLAGATLLAQRTVYREGEPIAVRARGRSMRGGVTSPPRTLAVTPRDGGEALRYTLTPDPATPGTAAASLPPLPAGVHRLQLLDDGGEPSGEPLDVLVAAGSVEERQTTQDRRALRVLADALGAELIDAQAPGGPAAVAAALAAADLAPESHPHRTTWRPWSTWPALLIIVALLGLEWFLRRRLGMS